MSEFDNLELEFRTGAGGDEVEARGPAGEGRELFAAPRDEQIVPILRLIERPRDFGGGAGARTITVVEREAMLSAFGATLYAALFTGTIATCYALHVARALAQSTGLRLRLVFQEAVAPRLAKLPWEYMRGGMAETFTAITPQHSIVRHVRVKIPLTRLEVTPPLNVLVVIATPIVAEGQVIDDLAVQREWDNINAALADLRAANLVRLDRIWPGTVNALMEQTQKRRPHVVHFVGHGAFMPDAPTEAVLLFDSDDHQAKFIALKRLIPLLPNTVRLVVLNTCNAGGVPPKATQGDARSYESMAQGLVRRGIPAVVAMQGLISDVAANLFAKAFYRGLANNHVIDDAVAFGRAAMYMDETTCEFGTPALFQSELADGNAQLFSIVLPNAEQLREQQIKQLSGEAKAAIDARDFGVAQNKVQELAALSARPLAVAEG